MSMSPKVDEALGYLYDAADAESRHMFPGMPDVRIEFMLQVEQFCAKLEEDTDEFIRDLPGDDLDLKIAVTEEALVWDIKDAIECFQTASFHEHAYDGLESAVNILSGYLQTIGGKSLLGKSVKVLAGMTTIVITKKVAVLAGLGAALGFLMTAHGPNTIYEGGAGIVGFVSHDPAPASPLKRAYRWIAENCFGLDAKWGDVAFSSLDIATSVAAFALPVNLKVMPVPFKFRVDPLLSVQFKRGREVMDGVAIFGETALNTMTITTTRRDFKEKTDDH